ncbi:hypothetical protein [Actinospica sp.]|jgi:hypothetical protein|nr:hypothetical protein [Actinospica sp.]HWG27738.1 hypothetical protein [Actinospica sp.]
MFGIIAVAAAASIILKGDLRVPRQATPSIFTDSEHIPVAT